MKLNGPPVRAWRTNQYISLKGIEIFSFGKTNMEKGPLPFRRGRVVKLPDKGKKRKRDEF